MKYDGNALRRGMRRLNRLALATLCCSCLSIPAMAQQQQQAGEMTLDEAEAAEHFISRGYSPYADRGFPTRPLWGDTHLHTANSPDAFAFGNRLGHPKPPARPNRGGRGNQLFPHQFRILHR